MIEYLLGIPLFVGVFIIGIFFFCIPGVIVLGGVFKLLESKKWLKIFVSSITNALFFTPVHPGGHNMFFVPLILSPISEYVKFGDLLSKWKAIPAICIALATMFILTIWYEKIFGNK